MLAGRLRCRSVQITGIGMRTQVRVGDKEYTHTAKANGNSVVLIAEETIVITEGDELRIEAGA